MASFLNTDLPSSDEEDDDYRPEVDKTAEAEDRAAFLTERKRHRDDEDDDDDEDRGHSLLAEDVGYSAQVKKAKIDHLWHLLNGKVKSAPVTPQPVPGAGPSDSPAGGQPAKTPIGPSSAVHLASLCRTVSGKERKKVNSDLLWMRNLGLLAPKQQRSSPTADVKGEGGAVHEESTQAATQGNGQQPGSSAGGQDGSASEQQAAGSSQGKVEISEDERALAAAALAAARSGGIGAVRNANKVTITETRRFAGKDIQVSMQVDKHSKEAAKAAQQASKPPPKSGLDAFLAEVAKKKKVNVLDKTKADWQQLKASDASLEEELEAHKRSGAQYLDKVGFLKRTELREYEAERDTRLASDVRTRGRL